MVRTLKIYSVRGVFFLRTCVDVHRSNLSGRERIAYTDAVKCLQRLLAKTNSTYAPGAKSRFDDFAVTHIEQTLSIHDTVSFTIRRTRYERGTLILLGEFSYLASVLCLYIRKSAEG
jgi:hypothetical protein